ncbi:MAG: hypothetical protein ACRC33_22805, partial [Gemmataceae bacterium]
MSSPSRPSPPLRPSRIVITVHGIRDFGDWQERLKALIETQDPAAEVKSYKPGWVDPFMFWMPIYFRQRAVRAFRDWLIKFLDKPEHAGVRVDIVAHSFGTHIVGWALLGLEKEKRPDVHTVIFAGSVLRSSFRWDELFLDGKVRRVLNECGTSDWPLLLSQFVVPFTGMAGRVGFAGAMSARFQNRFHAGFAHGDYFLEKKPDPGEQPEPSFMAREWVPLLTDDGQPPVLPGPAYTPDFWQRLVITLGNHAEPVKVMVYTALLALLVGLPVWLRQQAALRQAQLALSAQKADAVLLSVAGKLGAVSPTDLVPYVGEGKAAYRESHVRGESAAACSDALRLLLAVDPETQSAEGVKERLGKAVEELAAKADLTPGGRFVLGLARCGVPDRAGFDDLTRAASEFGQAGYAPGRALCLLRLASAHRENRQPAAAALALEACAGLVPADAPLALRLALLAEEAAQFRYSPERGRTLDALRRASDLARAEPLPAAVIHNLAGWVHLDWLETSAARDEFEAGLKRVRELDLRDGPPAALPLYVHLKHGQISVRRFEGDPRAAGDFRALAEEVDQTLARQDNLTPRQRWELRTRAVNALERAGDTLMLQQKPSKQELVAAEADYDRAINYMRDQPKSLKETWRPVQARCRS